MSVVFSADRTAIQSLIGFYSRLCWYTVWSAVGIILSSVRPSVCLWRCAFWFSGSAYRAKRCASVFLPSRHVPVCPFRQFCCRMHASLSYKMHPKKTSRRKREREFFQTQTTTRALV